MNFPNATAIVTLLALLAYVWMGVRVGGARRTSGIAAPAMSGDPTLFAREDYVEEAWRIVDPALAADTPVLDYEPHTWGPQAAARLAPPGGWRDPVVAPS